MVSWTKTYRTTGPHLGAASRHGDKARTNVMEDITTAEYSRQVRVQQSGISSLLIESPQDLGLCKQIRQMADETLQHISRTHGISTADPVRSAAEPHQGCDSQADVGATLRSTNIRTL